MSEFILTPINESLPCGSDCKYEDTFLNVEQEIDKTNSMQEDVSTDWGKVLTDTETILRESSKDSKVFCWWIYATWKQNGVAGLEKSLELFVKLLETYKNQLFPKSKKVKISSLVWLEDLLTAELLDEKGNMTVALNSKLFIEIFTNLQINFAICVEEEVDVFHKLHSRLERQLKEEEMKSVAQVVSAQTGLTNANTVELDEITSDADAAKLLRTLKKQATLLHVYWREKKTSDLRSIRLVRLLSWLEIDSLPMQEGGTTHLNPPSESSIDAIDSLIEDEKYDEAFERVESLIVLSPFWIEGHFIAFNVLTLLGEKTSALEIKNALIAFVKIDESILGLVFKDSTPFASIKLKKWLSDGMGTSLSNESTEIEDDNKEQLIEKAYSLAKKKQIKEAMELLQYHYASATNKEDKFNWRLVKAEVAIKFGKIEVGLALLKELKEDIKRYNLTEWKPALASKVFSLYLNSVNRAQEDIEDINVAYARLCQIDIVKALEIKF